MAWPKYQLARRFAFEKYAARRRAAKEAAEKAKRSALTFALKKISSLERKLDGSTARADYF